MIELKKDNKKQKMKTDISSTPVMGQPEDVFELINKYGTYEIQPTSDSGNAFPEIAQGYVPEGDSESAKETGSNDVDRLD